MRRPTVILLVLFVLLGALVWYMQQPSNQIKRALATSTPLNAASDETLISPNSGVITSFEITDASGKSVALDKSKGFWTINGGKDGPADQSKAEAAASRVFSLQIITRLEKAPDPAGTGLDKPAFSASVTLETSVITFKIGKMAPTGRGYYVETADGRVAFVNNDNIDALTANLFDPPFPSTAVPAVSETPATAPTAAP